MGLSFKYSTRNLLVRQTRTLLTSGVIALVVTASALFLALIHDLQHSLVSTGHPRNLIVLRKGADNDGSSSMPLEAYQALRFFDGIAKDAKGEPLASPEVVVQPFFETRDGGRENVLVRGVEAPAFAVHDDVRIVQGRGLSSAGNEALVGRGVAGRYAEVQLGSQLRFGRGTWTVVGIFESGGSSYESEVWVGARQLADDARRPVPYSGVRLRLAEGTDMDAFIHRVESDQRWALQATREADFYRKQSEATGSLYLIVIAIAVLAGAGAVFGATNTLYASVRARTAEIGTLRALGFSRGAIARAFLIESLLVALGGFALGAVLSWALASLIDWALGGVAFPMATFTTSVISLRITPSELSAGLALALAIGVLGGTAPALQASRLRPVEALRRA
jgi:ABC-type lipoprotein release transport system permease subunit